MGVGVLDVESLEVVPGTIHLEHVKDGTDIDETLSTLKHAQGKDDERIILAPQPSDDPNDPLNWPLSKKTFVVAITYSGTVLHTATTVRYTHPNLFGFRLPCICEAKILTIGTAASKRECANRGRSRYPSLQNGPTLTW